MEQDKKDSKIIIDYGAVNLKSLTMTNDIKFYEKMKTEGNIGVLFEPSLITDYGKDNDIKLYVVGILADK